MHLCVFVNKCCFVICRQKMSENIIHELAAWSEDHEPPATLGWVNFTLWDMKTVTQGDFALAWEESVCYLSSVFINMLDSGTVGFPRVSTQVPSHPATVHGNAAPPVSAPQPTRVDQLSSLLPFTDRQDPPPTEAASQKSWKRPKKTPCRKQLYNQEVTSLKCSAFLKFDYCVKV